ncbi:hypothetical protein [Selenihalanaerobacter shriftii]|uniref:DUF2680 domain-containing protein n=1 Tax=Selenihalanaerobacter shriftii TaxID=142842 RepID=A0A1T4JML1_9FIRM|nr:hypothetical protein [Selenihalanaerobacter shriftii]SJZ31394.1 hypothetical protein SAMN02745118_00213 [Selenihalanaerobacter shriftii]
MKKVVASITVIALLLSLSLLALANDSQDNLFKKNYELRKNYVKEQLERGLISKQEADYRLNRLETMREYYEQNGNDYGFETNYNLQKNNIKEQLNQGLITQQQADYMLNRLETMKDYYQNNTNNYGTNDWYKFQQDYIKQQLNRGLITKEQANYMSKQLDVKRDYYKENNINNYGYGFGPMMYGQGMMRGNGNGYSKMTGNRNNQGMMRDTGSQQGTMHNNSQNRMQQSQVSQERVSNNKNVSEVTTKSQDSLFKKNYELRKNYIKEQLEEGLITEQQADYMLDRLNAMKSHYEQNGNNYNPGFGSMMYGPGMMNRYGQNMMRNNSGMSNGNGPGMGHGGMGHGRRRGKGRW